ncbi:DUF397 domain-containing protein [Nocardia sp. CDC159]|uniref:DUF397 domain-containing protein n=1 Tax=Nocardia pulmonis TaxID=2951408 RepID=A0A9X2EFM0_9NOCA|nr:MULTISPECIES: DUF397 domain-containing protein [Nocardia]MCM6778590.1 DUF397 domain-containing protein [Nocardia pulmonis]MCM6791479.1 DUF397 domain-containing protein [Nocardia sp. CDC159]
MHTEWYKSTFSGEAQTCVEIAHRSAAVLIRDSKYSGSAAGQPIISVTLRDWEPFLCLALANSSGTLGHGLGVTVNVNGSATIKTRTVTLTYTAEEWDAFRKGIADGQFSRPRTDQ